MTPMATPCSEDNMAQHSPLHALAHSFFEIPFLRCSLRPASGRANLDVTFRAELSTVTYSRHGTNCGSALTDYSPLLKEACVAKAKGSTDLYVHLTILGGSLTMCRSRTTTAAFPCSAYDLLTHGLLTRITGPGMILKVSALI